jgi:hypothetical protein
MIEAPANPFTLARSDDETELETLARALRLASGFKLFLGRCNQPGQRRRLLEQIRKRLPNMDLAQVQLPDATPHLLDYLREHLPDPQPDALFISGIENSLANRDHPDVSPLVLNLNAARDSFPNLLRSPLVLWVSDYALAAIMRGAPDFFSIRSGVYYFEDRGRSGGISSGPPEETAELAVPPAERIARIGEIQELLFSGRSYPVGTATWAPSCGCTSGSGTFLGPCLNIGTQSRRTAGP